MSVKYGEGFFENQQTNRDKGRLSLTIWLTVITSHDRGLVMGEMNKWCKIYQRNCVKIFKTCKRNFQENYWTICFPTQISGIVGEN